jgi:hypothetical protein
MCPSQGPADGRLARRLRKIGRKAFSYHAPGTGSFVWFRPDGLDRPVGGPAAACRVAGWLVVEDRLGCSRRSGSTRNGSASRSFACVTRCGPCWSASSATASSSKPNANPAGRAGAALSPRLPIPRGRQSRASAVVTSGWQWHIRGAQTSSSADPAGTPRACCDRRERTARPMQRPRSRVVDQVLLRHPAKRRQLVGGSWIRPLLLHAASLAAAHRGARPGVRVPRVFSPISRDPRTYPCFLTVTDPRPRRSKESRSPGLSGPIGCSPRASRAGTSGRTASVTGQLARRAAPPCTASRCTASCRRETDGRRVAVRTMRPTPCARWRWGWRRWIRLSKRSGRLPLWAQES